MSLTSCCLDLEYALFRSTVLLKSVYEWRLDGEKGPVGKGRGARLGENGVDDSGIAALDRRAVNRKIERSHVL